MYYQKLDLHLYSTAALHRSFAHVSVGEPGLSPVVEVGGRCVGGVCSPGDSRHHTGREGCCRRGVLAVGVTSLRIFYFLVVVMGREDVGCVYTNRRHRQRLTCHKRLLAESDPDTSRASLTSMVFWRYGPGVAHMETRTCVYTNELGGGVQTRVSTSIR